MKKFILLIALSGLFYSAPGHTAGRETNGMDQALGAAAEAPAIKELTPEERKEQMANPEAMREVRALLAEGRAAQKAFRAEMIAARNEERLKLQPWLEQWERDEWESAAAKNAAWRAGEPKAAEKPAAQIAEEEAAEARRAQYLAEAFRYKRRIKEKEEAAVAGSPKALSADEEDPAE